MFVDTLRTVSHSNAVTMTCPSLNRNDGLQFCCLQLLSLSRFCHCFRGPILLVLVPKYTNTASTHTTNTEYFPFFFFYIHIFLQE